MTIKMYPGKQQRVCFEGVSTLSIAQISKGKIWILLLLIFRHHHHYHHQASNSAIVSASTIWSSLTLSSKTVSSTMNDRILSKPNRGIMTTTSDVTKSTSASMFRRIDEEKVEEVVDNTSEITNPYISGCLYSKGLVSHKRVCNSEDTVETITSGRCHSSPDFEYMEIRIHSNFWESITFEAWILQMILSELLDVPTTIEPGKSDGSLNFYNYKSDLKYSSVMGNETSLHNAYAKKDCRLANQHNLEEYEPCAHIYPEVWSSVLYDSPLQDLARQGIIEPPSTLGALGTESWYITKFTVENDPTLISFFGLSGEKNRNKLAKTFLRPTTWFDYCTQVSDSNCTIPNDVAQRFPSTIDEQEQFYSKNNYIGHFRMTDDNNCTLNPANCTGHVADYPCGWNSIMVPQIHYLNIALQSTGTEGLARGYSYLRLGEMWRAANATKSNLIMQYWSPEPLYQEFLGTDAEMFRISMPSRTQECLDHRRPLNDMCSESFELRIGEPEGICEESSKPIWKIIVRNLYDIVYDPKIPDAIRSPAYDVLKLFQISELQLGQIFDYRRIDNTTPRDAICRWVSENVDYVQSFVPRSYPRVIRTFSTDDNNNYSKVEPITYASTIMGGITSVIVMVTWYAVYQRRNMVQAIQTAQIEFLHLLLAGSLAVAIGSILVGLPPTNGSCTTSIWFIYLGYTFELVPLIVKIAAINKLAGRARQFRRVVVKRHSLFGAVFALTAVVLIFLVTWTIVDPPTKNRDYSLSGDIVSDSQGNNRTVVDVVYFCSSESLIWDYIAIGWNLLLLLCATVLAMQTRTVQKGFNESQTLAFLIYSHFLFVLLRLLLLLISGSLSATSSYISESTLSGLRSIIFSVDTMATIIIYFVPKFLSTTTDPNRSAYSISGLSIYGSGSVRNGSKDDNSLPIRGQSNRKRDSNNETVNNVREKDADEASMNPALQESFSTTNSRNMDDLSNDILSDEQLFVECEEIRDSIASNIDNNNEYLDFDCDNNVPITDF